MKITFTQEQIPEDLQRFFKPIPERCGACYVCHLTEVFREVKRVLRDDGVLWLNLGDSYSNDGKWGGQTGGKHAVDLHGNTGIGRGKKTTGLKPKDLVGIPWMVAFALRADGWYLRSDIIWSKANPMPESVQDRPTRSHEYIFLMTKNEKYFYDIEAIKELTVTPGDNRHLRTDRRKDQEPMCQDKGSRAKTGNPTGETRNKRTVWDVNPKPYPGAHFAVWPEKLVEPMVLAGSSARGCCGACGAPYGRIEGNSWAPPCQCKEAGNTSCVVLDPFSGSATTGMVALKLGRDYVGLDQNAKYLPLAEARILGNSPPANTEPEIEVTSFLDMFGG